MTDSFRHRLFEGRQREAVTARLKIINIRATGSSYKDLIRKPRLLIHPNNP